MSKPIYIRSNKASESGIKFFPVACHKKRCQLWIKDYDECAYVIDATKYSKDLLKREIRRKKLEDNDEKGGKND